MQRKDDIQDFDLLVREALQDASVKAPGGVWKAIRRELTSGADALSGAGLLSGRNAVSGSGSRWALVWATLSFATAIGIGMFFAWNTDKTGPEAERLLSIVPQTQVPGNAPSTGAQALSPAPQTQVPGNAPSTGALAFANRPENSCTGETGNVPTMAGDNRQDNPGIGETVGGTEEPERGNGASAIGNTYSDPFAEMERYDRLAAAARKRKPSLTLAGNLSSNSEFASASSFMGASGQGSGALVKTGIERFGIPLQISAGVKVPLGKKLSIGADLSYTLLSSTYDAEYGGLPGEVRHNMSYIGIPVNVFYNLLSLENTSVYVHTGVAAEYCIANTYQFRGTNSSTIKEPVKGFMYSAGIGLGMEFGISETTGIFIDPSFRYYFRNNHPTSIRTQKPQTFNFEAGVRFSL